MTLTDNIPYYFSAGDTVEWSCSIASYPASDGWVLSYSFFGAGIFSVTASSENDIFKILIDSATSANYPSGDYSYVAYVVKNGVRKEINTGFLTIKPDFTTISTLSDQRTHVKKVLDALEAVIEDRATQNDLSYSIAGRSISKMSLDELIKARSTYKKLYNSEILSLRQKRGMSSYPIKTHKIYFSETL